MKGVGDRCMNAFTQNSRKYELFYNDRKPENRGWEGGRFTKAQVPFFILMIS